MIENLTYHVTRALRDESGAKLNILMGDRYLLNFIQLSTKDIKKSVIDTKKQKMPIFTNLWIFLFFFKECKNIKHCYKNLSDFLEF